MANKKIFAAKFNQLMLISTDLFSLSISLLLASYFSSIGIIFFNATELGDFITGLSIYIFSILLVIIWIWSKYRHYAYRKPFWGELFDIYVTLFFVSLINLALFPLTKTSYSLKIWFYFWTMSIILFPIARFLIKKILRLIGTWNLDCVIIGDGENAKDGYRAITNEQDLGYNVKAFVAPEEKNSIESINGVNYLSETAFFNRLGDIQKVFIALEQHQSELAEHWIRKLNHHGYKNVSIIPPLKGIPLYGADVSHFFSYETIILRLPNNLAKLPSRFTKRSFDIIFSSLIILLLSPLFVYLFFKIRADGGSSTYTQIRVGRNGKAFLCYKFRTMVMDSQKVLSALLANNPQLRKQWYQQYKLKDDPRITKIGRFLRKTSLDEIPQLWNVLKGDMSLVGPRPIIREELKFYYDDIIYYYMVRPGLTGLWQVSGRSNTDYATRVYLDTWYVKNWSIWNDLVILAKTVKVVIQRKGAF